MPVTTIASYPPVMTEFEVHWGQLNADRTAAAQPEFLLSGAYGVTQFAADRAAIEQRLTQFEQLTNDQEFAQEGRDSSRSALRDRMINFRKVITAYLPDSRYERALPETPRETATSGKILKAADDVADLWSRLNAETLTEPPLPLELHGGYDLAAFNAEIATLRQRYETLTIADRELKRAREDRDQELQAAYDRMLQYRERVPLQLAEGDALVATLPRLNPSDPGGPDNEPSAPADDGADGDDTTAGGDAPEDPPPA